MGKPLKALLLSALIYPGTGHYVLKKYKRAIAFASLFSISLFFVITDIVNQANTLVEKIVNGEIPLDPATINESILNITTDSAEQDINIHIYVMLIIWGIAIVDTYRISREKN